MPSWIKIAEGQAVAHIAACDVDDEAQIGEHQRAGRVEIAVLMQPGRERLFILGAQYRYGIYLLDIVIQAANRTRQGDVVARSCQCLAHIKTSLLETSGILALQRLEC